MQKFLITGAAGFIGRALCESLLKQGHCVYALDNLNDYYQTQLKEDRLKTLMAYPNFVFKALDIAKEEALLAFVASLPKDLNGIIHLAAQAGVRYSIQNPKAYTQSNLVGMANILEVARQQQKALVFASSSSVYGQMESTPFKENMCTDFPVSFYAATKKANEIMAHSYSHLYDLPITALRFFTVYGPWGRPDMAPWLFTEAILQNRPIQLFNHGHLWRDFTFIDDIVSGIIATANYTFNKQNKEKDTEANKTSHKKVPFEIFNIGNHQPILLKDFVETLEDVLQKKAEKINKDMQDGDVFITCADTEKLKQITGFAPKTSLKDGLTQFVNWYKNYHNIA